MICFSLLFWILALIYATPRVTTTADDFSRCFHPLGNKTLSVKKQLCHATFEIVQYSATSVKLITLWILKKRIYQDGLEFVFDHINIFK